MIIDQNTFRNTGCWGGVDWSDGTPANLSKNPHACKEQFCCIPTQVNPPFFMHSSTFYYRRTEHSLNLLIYR